MKMSFMILVLGLAFGNSAMAELIDGSVRTKTGETHIIRINHNYQNLYRESQTGFSLFLDGVEYRGNRQGSAFVVSRFSLDGAKTAVNQLISVVLDPSHIVGPGIYGANCPDDNTANIYLLIEDKVKNTKIEACGKATGQKS